MDPTKSTHLVPVTKTLMKRPSDNDIQERAAKRGIAVAADEIIEAGNDSSSDDGPMEDLVDRTRKRVWTAISRRGEDSKYSWGTCCDCEAHGPIMTWPKCRHCLHNSCPTCQLGKTDDPDEEKRDSLEVSMVKVNELFGEIEMNIDPISSKKDLTAELKKELRKAMDTMANVRRSFNSILTKV